MYYSAELIFRQGSSSGVAWIRSGSKNRVHQIYSGGKKLGTPILLWSIPGGEYFSRITPEYLLIG